MDRLWISAAADLFIKIPNQRKINGNWFTEKLHLYLLLLYLFKVNQINELLESGVSEQELPSITRIGKTS